MLRKLLFTIAIVGLFSAVLTGCRAEAEVDDDMATTVAPLQ